MGWEPDRQGEAGLTSEWLGNFTLPCGENQAKVRVRVAAERILSGTSLPPSKHSPRAPSQVLGLMLDPLPS